MSHPAHANMTHRCLQEKVLPNDVRVQRSLCARTPHFLTTHSLLTQHTGVTGRDNFPVAVYMPVPFINNSSHRNNKIRTKLANVEVFNNPTEAVS